MILGRFAAHRRSREGRPARRRALRHRPPRARRCRRGRSRRSGSCRWPSVHRVDHGEDQWAAADRMKHLGESAAHPFALPRGEDHRVGPVTHVPASIRACRSRASWRRPYDEADAVLDARHRRPRLRRRLRRRRAGDAPGPRTRRGAPELDGGRSAADRPPPRLRARPPWIRTVAARADADPPSPRTSTC